MQLGIVAQPHMLGLSELEHLCDCSSLDIQRLAFVCGQNLLSGHAPSVDLGTAINMLIQRKGQRAGFEPYAMQRWLPHLRNETLFRLAEDIDNWSCPEPSQEWHDYIPNLYGRRKNIRPHIARLLPDCCIATTAWKVQFYSPTNVEVLEDENASCTPHEVAPRLVINADDLARQIQCACAGPLFTVRPKAQRAA
jgi:hypothetical protein